MASPTIALLAPSSPGMESGGAERLYKGLAGALQDHGVSIKLLSLTVDESSFEKILSSYLQYFDLDLSQFDGVISTKSPSFVVRHRNHVCYLPHTMRQFYDMHDEFEISDQRRDQANIVRDLDKAALGRASIKGIFTVGTEVTSRLEKFLNLPSKVLHHPTSMVGHRTEDYLYLFLPGRLHRWKRVDLAIESVRQMRNPINLIISGTGEDQERLKALARSVPQIQFTGHVSDSALLDLYANALAVIYCPLWEDYGLVTLESFLSAKPVVTCSDSGEPARIVRSGINGIVSESNPKSIAEQLDWLADNKFRAREMGRTGFEYAKTVSWGPICESLLAALGFSAREQDMESIKA